MACCKKAAPAEIKEKTPAQKAVDTRRKNIIAEQKEMLDKSTSAAAHKQWITKKNNEISAKDEKIILEKLKSGKIDILFGKFADVVKNYQDADKDLQKQIDDLRKYVDDKLIPVVRIISRG